MILTNLATEGGRKNLKGGTTWSIFSHFGGGGGWALYTQFRFGGGGHSVHVPPPKIATANITKNKNAFLARPGIDRNRNSGSGIPVPVPAFSDSGSGSGKKCSGSGSGKKTHRNRNNFTLRIMTKFSIFKPKFVLKNQNFRACGAKFHIIDVSVHENALKNREKNFVAQKIITKNRFFSKH